MERVFESRHTVRGYECDFYGHVNNAVYLNYLEFARMETLEAVGLSLGRLKAEGVSIVIRQITIRYRRPAEMGDRLRIESRFTGHSGARGNFEQRIVRESDGVVCAEAEVQWTVIDPSGRPTRIPRNVLDAFAAADGGPGDD